MKNKKTGDAARPRRPRAKSILVPCPVCGVSTWQLCVNLSAPGASKHKVTEYLRANLYAAELAAKTPHEARVLLYEQMRQGDATAKRRKPTPKH